MRTRCESDPLAAVEHGAAVATLSQQYAAVPMGAPIRLAKSTSNLFRFRDPRRGGLDVSAFRRVLSVDPSTRTAQVQGMTTYEHLVEATLAHGLMPRVVPQLKSITVGGAVAGLGIESSSFRNGLAHESVRQMEVLTGDGEVRVVTSEDQLFRGLPNSYGTLGYVLRLEVELDPVQPYVELRHVPFRDSRSCTDAIVEICRDRAWQAAPVDFIDGTVFHGSEMYLTLATFTDGPRRASDYTGRDIYYRSIQSKSVDHMTAADYLWRWDTDWFWCSRAFGVQHPLVRRLWPRRYRRSDVYHRLVAWDRRLGFSARIDGTVHEPVIQDVEIPVDRLPDFLEFFERQVGISPVWLCPLRLADHAGWPLYPMDPQATYVNVGFWSSVPLRPGEQMGSTNRMIEREVAALGGHKSLYSDSYYPREEFWERYSGPVYRDLKQRFDPDRRLPDLYAKCVLRA